MTIQEASSYCEESLHTNYEKREASNITRILFEDNFGITNLKSNKEFDSFDKLKEYLVRLDNREPIQYVTGKCNFYGIDFKVNKHVLIPRPETEELVHWIISDNKSSHKQLDVLDVGLGSGCIALTLKKKYSSFRIFGIEKSLDALNVARINSRKLNVQMTFYHFDFLDSDYWPTLGMFDIIVSNPPYISKEGFKVMSDNVLLYEPHMALFAGDDALVFYKRLVEFAHGHLKEKGALYVELNEYFCEDIVDLFNSNFELLEIKKDLQGVSRMLKAEQLRIS